MTEAAIERLDRVNAEAKKPPAVGVQSLVKKLTIKQTRLLVRKKSFFQDLFGANVGFDMEFHKVKHKKSPIL